MPTNESHWALQGTVGWGKVILGGVVRYFVTVIFWARARECDLDGPGVLRVGLRWVVSVGAGVNKPD